MTLVDENTPQVSVLEQLRWHKFPALNDGFVTLVDAMGTDSDIVQAARVSYGKDLRDTENGVLIADGKNLLRYLMRMRHTTPFEQAELKFLIRVPLDTTRQWHRHRTFSINEYSTRYTEAIDSRQTTEPDAWRLQATNNKQGSSGEVVTAWPSDFDRDDLTPGEYLTAAEAQLHEYATHIYEERLKFGVAKEVARKDLPLSTFTEFYWKGNLHNLLHFLGLRMDSHAQLEIRTYAAIIGEQIIARLFPTVWQAFKDYRLDAMQLSSLDIAVLQSIAVHLTTCGGTSRMSEFPLEIGKISKSIWPDDWRGEVCRERDECIEKLKRLGFVV